MEVKNKKKAVDYNYTYFVESKTNETFKNTFI